MDSNLSSLHNDDSSSSDDVSSDYDSDLEKDAAGASKKILASLQKNRKKSPGECKTRLSLSLTLHKKKHDNVKDTHCVIQPVVNENKTSDTINFYVDKGPVTSGNTGTCSSSIYNDNFLNENAGSYQDNTDRPNMAIKPSKKKSLCLSSSLQSTMKITDNYLTNQSKKKNVDAYSELMKKSVLTPDFEKQFALLPYEESIRQQKKQRRKEKEKTKGRSWYNMEAPEMTEEKKNDLTVIQMRKALDPKRFYKNNDTVALPKYFQFGTVVESSADFYHSRIPRKQRKSNMVEELLADAEFRKYNKRKYVEIQEQKRKAQGPYKHMKRLKKNKR